MRSGQEKASCLLRKAGRVDGVELAIELVGREAPQGYLEPARVQCARQAFSLQGEKDGATVLLTLEGKGPGQVAPSARETARLAGPEADAVLI